MDWTGGTRKRFTAGKTSAALQKQKSHFAKARAAAAKESHQTPRRRSSHSHKSEVAHSDRALRTVHQRSPSVINLLEENWNSAITSREPNAETPPEKRPRPLQDGSISVSLKDCATEEERLLAIRRGLLRRSDWLGLEVTRPVKMKFPISNDNHQIGKRRKVAHSRHHQAKKARPRTRTPLFEPFFPRPENLMSGALQTEDMRIKIGTEALASVTQVSQRLPLSDKKSVRSISSGPLSEESMLFGDDDDDFDMFQPVVADQIQQSTFHVPSVLTARGEGEAQSRGRIQQSYERDHSRGTSLYNGNIIENPSLLNAAVVSQTNRQEIVSPTDNDVTPGDLRLQTQQSDDVDADEENWRNLLGIKKRDREFESVAALASTSHKGSSTDVSRHSFALPEMPQDEFSEFVNFDQTDTQVVNLSDAESETEANLDRASKSLPFVNPEGNGALQRNQSKTTNNVEEDSDEAMWRAFVLGGRKASEGSQSFMSLDDEEEASPVRPPYSPSLAISGLGTSNYTTAGDQTFAPSEMTYQRSMY